MLQALHNLIRSRSNRPLVRCVLAVLLVALVSAGIPTGVVHSHAFGDAHDHHMDEDMAELVIVVENTAGVEAGQFESGAELRHVHFHGCSVPMLAAAIPDMTPVAPMLQRLKAEPPGAPPASATHKPLYRPPIA